ncbi:MAG: phenylalanine--tRNA ligase subunit beta [Candidatus Uhrbacteria bacterium]|nr:phenylalanine--tRNA ligase subunit beta [Candidatus Uhrbacteria bacterium]
MNILISYNWLKEYLDTDLTPEEFAQKTTNSGNSVERMHDYSKSLEHVVVGEIKVVKPHPNADKLRVTEVDIGGTVVEIVCGGSNLIEGHKVVVALPGARVRWHGEGDLVEITESTLRGVKSFGMICGVDEVGFETIPHAEKEIWDLTELTDAPAGTPLAKALDLDDVVMDIEVTSNRPDCMSVIGQAREGAAAIGGGMKELKKLKDWKGALKAPQVRVEEPALCPKYSAVRLEGITVGPSPWWIQKKLILAGLKPINNVVDITNYVLHEYGHPLHVFDADKLEGGEIIVRRAKDGETLKALDGKEYKLTQDMLIIADALKPVAIAGVMGGEETGVTATTTNILIESATFDPVSVRKTARALNLYSDSQLLFEKGLSTQSTDGAIARAIELVSEIAFPKSVSSIQVVEANVYEPRVFPFDPAQANALMGIEIQEEDMIETLARLGFEAKKQKDIYEITVPSWRDHDIEASVDFVEEIARVYGYDRFPSELPEGAPPLVESDRALVWQARAKEILKGAGVTETYSYSFVSEKQLANYGFKPEDAIHLKNPLSVDQAFMRPSLVPTMLTSIVENQAMFSEADLFEIAPVYLPRNNELPEQPLRLVIATYGKDAETLFLRAKGIMTRLFDETGVSRIELDRIVDSSRFHAGRSARILLENKPVGTIGQVSRSVEFAFGLDVTAVLVELDFEMLLEQFSATKTFVPLPQFPSVKRDLAFVLADRTEYATIERAIEKIDSSIVSVELFDTYRGKGIDPGKKSLGVRVEFRAADRTLESVEVDVWMNTLRKMLETEFGATMRM